MSQPAVLLLNLGSPASPSVPDVRSYLREFLWDERVLDTPAPLRWMVLNLFILPFRPKNSAEAYAKVWTPEGSPLVVTSKHVQQKVQAEVGATAKVALAMRYGEPSVASVVNELKKLGASRVFIVPLYPQYAMSSYETVVALAEKILADQMPGVPVDSLPPFFQHPAYIAAMVEHMRPHLEKGFDKVLFSFHGIPYRHLQKSDVSHAHCLSRPDCCDGCHPAHLTCYRHQSLRATELITAQLGLKREQYEISFQSRLGRDPWLRPYTDFRLRDLPGEGIKRLLVVCPAFVSDCLETLEEIAMRGKEIFEEAGGKEFALIPCLNEHPAWIAFLRGEIDQWVKIPSIRGRDTWRING